MSKEVAYGDRLISVALPSGHDWHVRRSKGIREITVGRLPGPEGYYLTAQVTFEDGSPDIIMPLHMVLRFEIQYGD